MEVIAERRKLFEIAAVCSNSVLREHPLTRKLAQIEDSFFRRKVTCRCHASMVVEKRIRLNYLWDCREHAVRKFNPSPSSSRSRQGVPMRLSIEDSELAKTALACTEVDRRLELEAH